MGRAATAFGLSLGMLACDVAVGAWTMHPPKGPPSGQAESCTSPAPVDSSSTDCESCASLELINCKAILGANQEENKIYFTVKNHNSKYSRSSMSARFGHVGVGPSAAGAAPAAGSASGGAPASGGNRVVDFPAPPPATATAADMAPGNVSLAIPSSATPDSGTPDEYPAGTSLPVWSESMPETLVLAPNEERTFEVDGITNFPVLAQCNYVMYMAVDELGQLEQPYLWNRNYACTVLPCQTATFKMCTVEGGAAQATSAGQGITATPNSK